MTPERQRWLARATALLVATVVYNVVEAVVAIGGGVAADSIALFGFGLDSVLEVSAAAVVLWRLRLEARGADPERVERGERRVGRVVGITFFGLALYILAEAGLTLWHAEPPDQSVLGIVLAALSLTVMPLLAWGKLRAAHHLGSGALRAEAKETIACSYLSASLLLGLGAHALFGVWWADPAAALLMVPWLVREGWEGVVGDDDD